MKLTALELAVLKAIDESEYGGDLTDLIWTFSVDDHLPASIKSTSIPGIVSSLVKKGLVVSSPAFMGDDATIGMTSAGAEAYIAAVGIENVKKYIEPKEGATK